MEPLFDFYDYVLRLTSQIPQGKISTYKELAIALGDEISARAKKEFMVEMLYFLDVRMFI